MNNEPPLQDFINGDDTVLKNIYIDNRLPFINFARKYQLDQDEILDIYQDTIIAMHENFTTGKVQKMQSSIKTYLFSIGKYKIYAHLRENNKMRVLDDQHIKEEEETQDFDFAVNNDPLTEKQTIIKAALEKMGGQCCNILKLFYYRSLTIDEIRISEGYENNNTVKSQKSRCLKKLKEMILNPER